MSSQIKTAFRPAVEAIEGRILATVGLAAAAVHGQSWVEIENRSGRNLSYQISFNDGQSDSTLTVKKGHSAYAHVNQAVGEVLIGLNGGTSEELTPGPSKRGAAVFVTTPADLGGSTVTPAPIVVTGGSEGASNPVGEPDTLPQSYVVLLNQSGQNVTLAFTNNNGRNYLDLTIGAQYISLSNPYFVSLDQTSAGIKIQNPNGRGLLTLASSPSLNSAPVYFINTDLSIIRT